MSQKQTASRISGYSVMAVDTANLVGFGPRYTRRPQDDTTTFGVEHRTIGGYVGVLFEREEFRQFAAWLAADWPEVTEPLLEPFKRPTDDHGVPLYVRQIEVTGTHFRIIDGQTGALVSKTPGYQLTISCKWLGSGSGRSAVLDEIAAGLLTEWATDVDAHGWAGWRSGRDSTEA